MQGLVVDINVQGHLDYLLRMLTLDLRMILNDLRLTFATLAELQFTQESNDREIWNFCQKEGWVLLTENRNHDGADSLGAVLIDSWQAGHLPVLTLSNKRRFERDRVHAERVAYEVTDLRFGLIHGENRDQQRIFVPRK